MKILFVVNHIHGTDGWSRYARDLARVYVNAGHEVVCCVHEVSPGAKALSGVREYQCLGTPIPYVGNPLLAWKTARAVNPIIRHIDPDILHIIVEPYATMLPFLHTGRAKIVMTAHSTFAFFPVLVRGVLRKLWSRIITRIIYRRAEAVICVSKYTKEHLLRHMAAIGSQSLVEGNISVIAGGVDVSGSAPRAEKPAHVRKEILFVGAVKQRKGVIEAVEALAHVKTPCTFRIVGSYRADDPYVKKLRDTIHAHGLTDSVVLTGQISDEELARLYNNADVFVMLSTNNGGDFEGYGLVYIEANAHGVPAIGPNDSGVSDAIVDGKTGYLVNQYDAPAVARKIDDILERHTIVTADCVAWARENSIEKKGMMVLEVYRKLVS